MILWSHVHNSSTGPTEDAVGTSFEDHRHNTSHGLTTLPIILPAGSGVLLHTHNASIYRLESVAYQVAAFIVSSGDGAHPKKRAPLVVRVSGLSLATSIQLHGVLTQTRVRPRALEIASVVQAAAEAYVGPSEEDIAGVIALLLNRRA